MASTFKILQEGKDEIVTASFSISSLSAPRGYSDCGLYKLTVNWSTPSGNKPKNFNWGDYISYNVFNDSSNILQYSYFNPFDYCLYLYFKANIINKNCEVDTSTNVDDFPNGKMLCDDIQPSGAAAVINITLLSTDETKVTIDKSKNEFVYSVTG